MLIIGTFEHSIDLELALDVLEHNNIPQNHIMVIPMDTDPKTLNQFVSKSHDTFHKGIEVGIACATASSVVGTSVGFILEWGPVIWGLTAALTGFFIGLGIYFLANKVTYRHLPKKLPEVTVIVQCRVDQYLQVIETMWKYHSLSVGRGP